MASNTYAKQTQTTRVVEVSINDLKPALYNPRTIDELSMEQLKESIKRFGLIDPIIVNSAPKRKNIVIGGHQRLKAAKLLGFTSVPVVYVHIPSLKQEKELNIRLNKNTGTWDFEKLKELDIEALLEVGFTDDDLQSMWDSILEIEDDEFEAEKELAKITKTNIKPGDLFTLGSHRLICGDSTDTEVVKRLVGGEQMDVVYCDPPYNIGFDYHKGIGGKAAYGGLQTNDSKTDSDYEKFLKATMANALSVAHQSVHVFYWCDSRYIGLIQKLFAELGINSLRGLLRIYMTKIIKKSKIVFKLWKLKC